MTEFNLSQAQHDATICTEIGVAAGQEAGGWSIGHRSEGDNVILTLPDGKLTKAQFDAVVASHEPSVAVTPVDRTAQFLSDLEAAFTTADVVAALIKRFGG